MTYSFKTKPYAHQLKALDAARDQEGFAFLMEMRTGKSKVILDELGNLYERGIVDCAVIFAPKGVYANWLIREVPAHMPDRLREKGKLVLWKTGGGNEGHKKLLRDLVKPHTGLRLLFMNIEALSSGNIALKYLLAYMKSAQVGCYAAIDESTRIKNHRAVRTKTILKQVKPLAKVRRIASGLVVPRSPLDAFSQFAFLVDRPFGHSSYFSFQCRYAITQRREFGGRKVDLVVGYRDEEDLKRRMAELSFRVRKDECFDVPKTVYMPRDVELTDEQRRMYNDMKEFATSQIEGESFVSANLVITQMLRLHQLVCGHVVDELGTVHDVPSNRLDALMEALEEIDDKVVIWSWYQHDTAKIVAALSKEYGPESVVEYHGGTKSAQRIVSDHRLREDPKCRYMVSSQSTGGMGLDWRAAGVSLYYSSSPDLELRAQSEERVFDPHAKAPKACIDLIARGTVDEKFVDALRKKINLASVIMGDGVREWLI